MSLSKLRKDAGGALSAIIIVLIVILMVSASSVAILLYSTNQSNTSPSSQTVAVNDEIKVDYIGRLADGRVFDTSLYSVASNDALYPKSLSFTMRTQSQYSPLDFTVGSGQVIKGFDQGVVGMKVGETKVIEVPPDMGYGQLNESKMAIGNLIDVLQVYLTLNYTNFESYYGTSPQNGTTVLDPLYGWDVNVISTDQTADQVVVRNMPTIGHQYAIYGDPSAAKPTGWYVEVTSIDSAANGGKGEILVHNLLTDADAGYVQGVSAALGTTFIVDQVDEAAGTYRVNFNQEVVGVTLYFTVTVVEIVSSP
jgi:FKBP-type peptidyl-prolyl cis-trans isomerase 2